MIGIGVPTPLSPIRRLKKGMKLLLPAEFRSAIAGEAEETGVLEEELALLGEKEIEARQIHLLLIDLHLGEIGSDMCASSVSELVSPYFTSTPPSTSRPLERAGGLSWVTLPIANGLILRLRPCLAPSSPRSVPAIEVRSVRIAPR